MICFNPNIGLGGALGYHECNFKICFLKHIRIFLGKWRNFVGFDDVMRKPMTLVKIFLFQIVPYIIEYVCTKF